MKYYLSREVVLKWLETPCAYHIRNDELYELDLESFDFLKKCSKSGCHSRNREFTDYCLKEELLAKKRAVLKQPPLIKSPDPSLRYLELQITNKCNLTCKHCYINPSPPPFNSTSVKGENRVFQGSKKRLPEKLFNELSVKQIKIILEEFEHIQGLRLLITGGEPILHSKFEEINEMLPQFFLRKVLFTNGILLSKKKMKKLNVNEIQISIDGLEDAHDALRGKGTYRLAMKAVKNALGYGFYVSVATMVHPGNLKLFGKMERLFRGMGVREWTVDIPCITGRLEENRQFQIRPEAGGRYLKYGYGGGLHTANPGFACGLHLMSVLADGKVTKCTFYSGSAVGRIEEGLKTCWERIKPVRLDELQCDCEYIDLCRGGCRYRAGLFGNIFGKDPYRCALYRV
jgi:radical SAM protein with 4Fe4S-binding SPASM domain